MRYMNALKNQWRVSQAWMVTSSLLVAMCVYLTIAMVAQANNQPIRLVPQGYDANDGPITVTNSIEGNDRFLTLIALSDLQSYTTWTPRTVVTQISRFANRMTPSLFAVQGSALEVKAKANESMEQSQSLYVSGSKVEGTSVVISGTLQVWQGMQQVEATPMTYKLTYSQSSGLPRLAAFSAKKEKIGG